MLLYRVGSASNNESFLAAIEGHKRIVERLQARDAAGAEKAICDHLEQVKNESRAVFAKLRAAGRE